MSNVSCPFCNGLIANNLTVASQLVICPHCRGQIQMPPIPGPQPQGAPLPPTVVKVPPAGVAPTSQIGRKKPSLSATDVFLILGGGAILIGVAVGALKFAGRGTGQGDAANIVEPDSYKHASDVLDRMRTMYDQELLVLNIRVQSELQKTAPPRDEFDAVLRKYAKPPCAVGFYDTDTEPDNVMLAKIYAIRSSRRHLRMQAIDSGAGEAAIQSLIRDIESQPYPEDCQAYVDSHPDWAVAEKKDKEYQDNEFRRAADIRHRLAQDKTATWFIPCRELLKQQEVVDRTWTASTGLKPDDDWYHDPLRH